MYCRSVTKGSHGVLNEDPTVQLDGARPPSLVLWVLPLPENEFGKDIIFRSHDLQFTTISCKIFEPLGLTSRIQQLSSYN
jgi:hypothetical protein